MFHKNHPISSSHQPNPISFEGIEFQPQKILPTTTRETYTQQSQPLPNFQTSKFQSQHPKHTNNFHIQNSITYE
jgi:hypothetical protein